MPVGQGQSARAAAAAVPKVQEAPEAQEAQGSTRRAGFEGQDDAEEVKERKHHEASRGEQGDSPSQRRDEEANDDDDDDDEDGGSTSTSPVIQRPTTTTSPSAHPKQQQQQQQQPQQPDQHEGQQQQQQQQQLAQSQPNPWQAIWSPQFNAYYFHNVSTGETTWENPFSSGSPSSSVPLASSSTSTSTSTSQLQLQQQQGSSSEEGALDIPTLLSLSNDDLASHLGLDPNLPFLDPQSYVSSLQKARRDPISHLLPSFPSSQHGNGIGRDEGGYAIRGAFDRRTGRFVEAETNGSSDVGMGMDPGIRFSASQKAKRQQEAFFDVEEWERRRGGIGTEGKGKEQRVRKGDVEMYRERERERKRAKQGWLRS